MPRGTINGEPYEVPDGYEVVSEAERRSGSRAKTILSDLDRSPVGRHRGDVEAQSPTGFSEGNPLLPPGTHIGYTLGGQRIVVPENTEDLAAWVQEASQKGRTHG